MIRPVRETMGTIVGKGELRWLFLAGFLAMCVLVPLYAALVKLVSRKSIARVVFHCFAVSSIGFWAALKFPGDSYQLWVARLLFVWVSVFGIFATSVFWSVLADLFSSAQGRRFFGIIASGGTMGGFSGSLMARLLAERFDAGVLLLFPAVFVEIGLVFSWLLVSQVRGLTADGNAELNNQMDQESDLKSGGLYSGVAHVFRSTYLLRLCGYLMLVQGFGTLLYDSQASIVRETIVEEGERLKFFANLDLGVQTLTLVIQLLLYRWILGRFGIAFALIILPIIYFLASLSLSFYPTLGVLAVAMMASRAFAYGLTVPAREVLFTVVSREDKYKAKNFIDTVIVRGGDTISMQLIGVFQTWGASMAVLNLGALPLACVWGVLAWGLGKKQMRLDASISSMAASVDGKA